MGKLLPGALMLTGLLAGLGAGYAMKPEPQDCEDSGHTEVDDNAAGEASSTGSALENQTDAGHASKPAAVAENTTDCASDHALQSNNHRESGDDGQRGTGLLASSEFAKLPTQFVIPVLDEGRMRALVVLSVSLEIVSGTQEEVFSLEPKLRDAFLKVMFRHANSGGFNGNFTDRRVMEDLRGSLHQAAENQLGDKLIGILILDIVRQDVG